MSSPRPVIETGTGPFDWVCEDFGHDAGGPYWNYSARFQGIELRRQARKGGGEKWPCPLNRASNGPRKWTPR